MTRVLASSDAPTSTHDDDEDPQEHTSLDSLNQQPLVSKYKDTIRSASLTVRLAFRPFLACWLSILLFHVVTAVILLQYARFYRFLSNPQIGYYVRLVDVSIDQTFFLVIAMVYRVLSALNVIEVVRMLWFSFVFRRPVLPPWSGVAALKEESVRASLMSTVRLPRRRPVSRNSHIVVRVLYVVNQMVTAVFSERGLLGIKGRFFNWLQTLRKIVQILMLMYQANQVSQLVTQLWINNYYVVAIIFNCVSTPLIFGFVRRQEGLLRVLCLVCDIVSGVFTAVVLPYSLYRSYASVWDGELMGFGDEYLYDDVWFVNGILENRMIISTTWVHLLVRVYPFLEWLLCLDSIKILVRERPSLLIRRLVFNPCRSLPSLFATRSPSEPMLMRAPGKPPVLQRQKRRYAIWMPTIRPDRAVRQVRRRVHSVFLLFAILTGLFSGISHIPSASVPGCKATVKPWFTLTPSCAVLEINCYRHRFSGNASSIKQVMKAFRPTSTISIIFAHCPELEISSEIQSLSNVIGVEIYNSTLVKWSQDAAMSHRHHTTLTFIAIVLTKLQSMPEGLLTEPIPSLMDVELSFTNLSALPRNMHVFWPKLSTLTVEHSRLTEIPESVQLLTQVTGLAFTDNHIQSMPSALFDDMTYLGDLYLSWNPYTDLSMSLGPRNPSLSSVMVGHTNISTLPSYFLDADVLNGLDEFSIDSTPLCLNVKAHQSDYAPDLYAVLSSCKEHTKDSRIKDSYYPVSVVMPHRPV
ncbi:hypothetical protein Poli38472_011165 [Pythium oligandrum]|uniref:Uncharacterized protein n=1 Tax=Pythium oligandrum TaxID=41045 RepID=A0A8K1FKV7_PYTOL|nr:hypothetical protein Poli38472_011165 [Pythium oligandrum]|eukprot:TMW67545.1 hypothetical protein Poli38472_011165 [Pythium oligandrum]